jgi:hypothetical protein
MRLYGKYIDLVVQSLCIVIATVIVTVVIIESKPRDGDWQMAILCIQLVLGPWQFVGSLISVLRRTTKSPKLKSIHLLASMLYLASLFPLHQIDFASKYTLLIFMTVPAWILATGYYIITWHEILKRSESGKGFLPHLGF